MDSLEKVLNFVALQSVSYDYLENSIDYLLEMNKLDIIERYKIESMPREKRRKYEKSLEKDLKNTKNVILKFLSDSKRLTQPFVTGDSKEYCQAKIDKLHDFVETI